MFLKMRLNNLCHRIENFRRKSCEEEKKKKTKKDDKWEKENNPRKNKKKNHHFWGENSWPVVLPASEWASKAIGETANAQGTL